MDDGLALAVVVDGMGGNASGRIPAELAVDVVRGAFARRFGVIAETWWRAEHGGQFPLPAVDRPALAEHVRHLLATRRAETPGDAAVLAHGLGDLVCTSLAAANEAVVRRMTYPSHRFDRISGATAAAAIFAPGMVAIGHIGNVRVYRQRAGRLELLTRDHTLVNYYALHMPDLTEEQLAELPQGIVVRAVGMKETIVVDVVQHPVEIGDAWLLLSRGLYATLDVDAIAGIVAEHGAAAGAALVEEARGQARDDLTALVVTVSAEGA